jgi:hypothetical protein
MTTIGFTTAAGFNLSGMRNERMPARDSLPKALKRSRPPVQADPAQSFEAFKRACVAAFILDIALIVGAGVAAALFT